MESDHPSRPEDAPGDCESHFDFRRIFRWNGKADHTIEAVDIGHSKLLVNTGQYAARRRTFLGAGFYAPIGRQFVQLADCCRRRNNLDLLDDLLRSMVQGVIPKMQGNHSMIRGQVRATNCERHKERKREESLHFAPQQSNGATGMRGGVPGAICRVRDYCRFPSRHCGWPRDRR